MNNTELIMYETEDGKTKIDVRMENETVWLSLEQMSDLFQRDKSTISRHIKNIFDEGELTHQGTVANFATVQSEGNRTVTRNIDFYNLDVIISVGYRVKSLRGTQFRIWATEHLKEYLIKGFTMNDDFLKNAGGGKYWRELLERIRDIRSSEKVFYRQVLDLYATSIDYNPNAPESIEFFKIVQNKLHYAAHGHTAAEIISSRANSDLPFMGMTVVDGARVTKSQVGIAKNYLDESELKILNQMVSAFFDLAELRAMNHQPMYMSDWIKEVDAFTGRYGKGVLTSSGSVSHKAALEKAYQEYEIYKKKQFEELTPVEQKYLEHQKQTQKKLKGND